ncbi:MAG: hypothetical protein R2878_03065 [Thermoleophilia bacterium]
MDDRRCGSLDVVDLIGGGAAIGLGAPSPSSEDRIPLAATIPTNSGERLVWAGEVDLVGQTTTIGSEVWVRRGFSTPISFSELLTGRPPTLFFLNGTAVHGREYFDGGTPASRVPPGLIEARDWTGVDIQAETRRKAAENAVGISIHERAEEMLSTRPLRGKRRWVLMNDGAGEIADHIVVETLDNGQVAVELWHSKFAGGRDPAVRVTDLEVVTAQAIKSRRWPTDRSFWEHLEACLSGHEQPPIEIVDGDRRPLEVLLGLHPRWAQLSLARRRPSVVAAIVIVQPGLSEERVEQGVSAGDASALQIAQLLTVFSDAVRNVATPSVIASS